MGHYVEWKPFYSVGDAALDGEHQRLLGIVDDLHAAIEAGHEQSRIQGSLNRLAEYTMTHFDHEEQKLYACAYPDLDAHKIMHEEMRRRALEFQANPDMIADRDLLQFVKNWWVRHIQNQDKKYAPYLDAVAPQTIKMA
jgi:hemerythrin